MICKFSIVHEREAKKKKVKIYQKKILACSNLETKIGNKYYIEIEVVNKTIKNITIVALIHKAVKTHSSFNIKIQFSSHRPSCVALGSTSASALERTMLDSAFQSLLLSGMGN